MRDTYMSKTRPVWMWWKVMMMEKTKAADQMLDSRVLFFKRQRGM